MTMQILEIVVFSHDNQRRILPLHSGRVNIITGASKTGKSALVEIVNYCYGADECEVFEGPIRRSVSWFGLKLKLDVGQAFIARRCPEKSAKSSEECFVDVGDIVEAPKPDNLKPTTNTKGLGALLAGWSSIIDNLHEPPDGQTRASLTATIRHALTFCFQPQDEIIRRKQLFHGAVDNFKAQALKDTLPFFLGAVDDDYVRKREKLRRLRAQLRECERQLSELKSLRGEGISKAATLLAQARDVGLSSSLANTWEETVNHLTDIAKIPLGSSEEQLPDGLEYTRLSEERDRLLEKQKMLNEEISAARAFENYEKGFSQEAIEQRARLVSIGIFEGSEAGQTCPLCSQEFSESLTPSVSKVKEALTDVSKRLDSVTHAAPKVEIAIGQLESRLLEVRSKLAKNRSQMEAVRNSDDRLQRIHDKVTRQALIIGRITLYLESLPELPDTRELEQKVKLINEHLSDLKKELSDEYIKERLESILSILGQRMTEWAKTLELEHSKYPLRLDLKKLTIIADTVDGPVPMDRMGSGENWVGYHLIGHLALHEWFCNRSRPVPRFLFLDQPSQVYFPPEKDIDGSLSKVKEDDRKAVSRMFRFVFEVVEALAPGFQVIITEHADINEDWYQNAVIERWRGGLKLIPDDWPRLN